MLKASLVCLPFPSFLPLNRSQQVSILSPHASSIFYIHSAPAIHISFFSTVAMPPPRLQHYMHSAKYIQVRIVKTTRRLIHRSHPNGRHATTAPAALYTFAQIHLGTNRRVENRKVVKFQSQCLIEEEVGLRNRHSRETLAITYRLCGSRICRRVIRRLIQVHK